MKRKLILFSLLFMIIMSNASANSTNCNISQENNKIKIIFTDSLDRIIQVNKIVANLKNYSYYFDSPNYYIIENYENIEKNVTIDLFYNNGFDTYNFSYLKSNYDVKNDYADFVAFVEDNYIYIIIISAGILIFILCFIILSHIISDMK